MIVKRVACILHIEFCDIQLLTYLHFLNATSAVLCFFRRRRNSSVGGRSNFSHTSHIHRIAILNLSLILLLLLLTLMIAGLTNFFFSQSTEIKILIDGDYYYLAVLASMWFASHLQRFYHNYAYSFWWIISKYCIYNNKIFKYDLLISLERITFQSNEKKNLGRLQTA